MATNDQYRDLMRRVFDELREGVRDQVSPQQYQELRESFAFHMSDWANDIEKIRELRNNSDTINADEAAKEVVGLLYHLIPHLVEAGNLLLDGVGSGIRPTKSNDSIDQTVRT